MGKRTKRLLSFITAAAMSVSAFAGLTISASAGTAIDGASFNFDTGSNLSVPEGNLKTDPAKGILMSFDKVDGDTVNTTKVMRGYTSSLSGGRTMDAKFPDDFTIDGDTTSLVEFEFDWFSYAYGGNGNYKETALIDAAGNKIFNIAANNGSSSNPAGAITVNGVTVADKTSNAWYHVYALLDFETKTVLNLSLGDFSTGSNAVTVLKNAEFLNKNADKIAGFHINANRVSNLYSDLRIDNIVATDVAEDYFDAVITVKNTSSQAVSGVTVTIDGADYTTGDDGTVTVKLLKGQEYPFVVSASGYETPDGSDTATGTITENNASQNVTYSVKTYTQEVGSAKIGGGQAIIAAPATGTAQSTEFTVSVKDQYDLDMTEGYTATWAIYPTGTTTAANGVTIAGGVVSVTDAYKAANGADAGVFDVIVTVTDNTASDKTATDKVTVIITNSDILLYDTSTAFTASGNTSVDYDIEDVTIPSDGIRITFDYSKGKYDSTKDTSYGKLTFKNGNNAVFYMEDKNAGLTLYTDDTHSVSLGSTARDTDAGPAFRYRVELNIIGTMLIAKIGDGDTGFAKAEYKVVEFATAPTQITAVNASTNQTGGSGTGAKNLVISSEIKVDKSGVNILGDDAFAKIYGKSVERQYTAKANVPEDSDSFTWSVVKKGTSAAPTGVSIDQTGKLAVTSDAETGVVTISVVSGEKSGSRDVTINDYASFGTGATVKVDGPRAFSVGQTGTYKVTALVDEYGDDVLDQFTAEFASSNAAAVEVNSATGAAEAKALGTADITVKVGNNVTGGTDMRKTLTISGVTVGNYYKTVNLTNGAGEIDFSSGIENAGKYLVTVADGEGNKLAQTTVTPAQLMATTPEVVSSSAAKANAVKIVAEYDGDKLKAIKSVTNVAAGAEVDLTAGTNEKVFLWNSVGGLKPVDVVATSISIGNFKVAVNIPGAAKMEAAPVYNATVGATTPLNIPADRYNLTIHANNADRTDVRVNGQTIVNNLNQGSDNWSVGRIKPATADYEIDDVVIAEGYASFVYDDHKGDAVDSIDIVKAPSIVNRAKRIYVVGDSLVATYYGDAPAGQENFVRTGWGQVFSDYIVDDVAVTNLGNSGAWATGMLDQAFSNIRASAQAGDIVIWESGYNDKEHSNVPDMNKAITEAATVCAAKGVKFYVVNPNASCHGTGWKTDVQYAQDIRNLAAANPDTMTLIELSATSYKFLSSRYTQASPIMTSHYNNENDKLHSSYIAANCWAAIVAQGLYNDGQTDIVDTGYSFTYNDTQNDITVGVGQPSITSLFTTAD